MNNVKKYLNIKKSKLAKDNYTSVYKYTKKKRVKKNESSLIKINFDKNKFNKQGLILLDIALENFSFSSSKKNLKKIFETYEFSNLFKVKSKNSYKRAITLLQGSEFVDNPQTEEEYVQQLSAILKQGIIPVKKTSEKRIISLMVELALENPCLLSSKGLADFLAERYSLNLADRQKTDRGTVFERTVQNTVSHRKTNGLTEVFEVFLPEENKREYLFRLKD
jgi:hypothetical protein